MIKYCYEKWYAHKDELEKAIVKNFQNMKECSYKYLVKLVVDTILNGDKKIWDSENIADIDYGYDQGETVYAINTIIAPGASDILITYNYYGSCSGCDALQAIQRDMYFEGKMSEQCLKDFMSLCRDLVTRMKAPFTESPEFQPAEWEYSKED